MLLRIKNQEKWTEVELEQRDAILQDEAVALWPRPETAYRPPVRQMDRVTLDEDRSPLSSLFQTPMEPSFRPPFSSRSKNILKTFRQTEAYLFRRTICDLPTNALNKIFLFLHRDIINLDGTAEGYCKKLTYTLNGKRESGRFPTDEEFRVALSHG